MPVDAYVEMNTPGGSRIGGPAASSDIGLASVMPGDMTDPHPVVDATNGPLTADGGVVFGGTTMPAPAGKTLYRWNSGVFRTQGMNWQSATTPANNTGQVLAINNSTPRKWTYGTSQGFPLESNHDFAFLTDSQTVTIVYWHWTGYTSSNYHDSRVFVEHYGRLKQLRNSDGTITPRSSTAGGGWYSQTLTFKEARERQVRVFLPGNCFVLGVYIDALATIRKAANVLWFAHNGDSWGEPNRAAGSVDGAAYPAGKQITYNLVQELAASMGAVWTWIGEGGTGEFVCNTDGNQPQTFTGGAGESVFGGETRLADYYTKFSGIPICTTVGGWNDGALPGTGAAATTAYQTRVQQSIDRHKAKASAVGRGARLIFASIQPVDQAGSGGSGALDASRAPSLVGQRQAVLDPQNASVILGWVDLTPMWANMSMAGQRGANVKTDDTIHLNAKGAELVARWMGAAIRQMTIPASVYADQLKAVV